MNAIFEVTLSAAFIGGLAGGIHCAGMCGGIVHALCTSSGSNGRNGAPSMSHLLVYNAGRVASYACAGALAGTLGQAAMLTRAAPLLQPVMFALASLALIALGMYLVGVMPMMSRIEAAGTWLWRGIRPWTRYLLPVTSLPRALGLGALWGWLPCGMVYVVLLMALALGSWWQGAAVMLAFGLGTLPNLLGIGLLWRQLGRCRAGSAPRLLAGCTVALFGAYGMIKIMQPIAISGGEMLCYTIPGLGSLFR